MYYSLFEEEKQPTASTNSGWFVILAVMSGLSTVLVYAVLVWFVVCREKRLETPDEEKKCRAYREKLLKIKNQQQRNEKIDCFFDRIRSAAFGQDTSIAEDRHCHDRIKCENYNYNNNTDDHWHHMGQPFRCTEHEANTENDMSSVGFSKSLETISLLAHSHTKCQQYNR
jgi:hypothetical protein